jgi:hypothetical protein
MVFGEAAEAIRDEVARVQAGDDDIRGAPLHGETDPIPHERGPLHGDPAAVRQDLGPLRGERERFTAKRTPFVMKRPAFAVISSLFTVKRVPFTAKRDPFATISRRARGPRCVDKISTPGSEGSAQ